MPPDPYALPPTWTPGHFRGCPKEWEPSGTCTCPGGDLGPPPGIAAIAAVAQAAVDRIAAKVDGGEPVSVEPGGYRALTEEQLAIFEAKWKAQYGTPEKWATAMTKSWDDAVAELNTPEPKWVGPFTADDWQAGDPDPGFGRPPDIPDSWRWTTLGLVVAALAVWRWRHGR